MSDQQGVPASSVSAPPDLVAAVAAQLAELQNGSAPPAPNGYTVRQPAASNVIDLDEQLRLIDTSPQPVLLGGHTYQVRRDFTVEQGGAALRMASDPARELEFWTELVGANDAQRIKEYTDPMPIALSTRVAQQLLVASGIWALTEQGAVKQGEA